MIGPYRVLEGAEERAVIADVMARIPQLAKAGDITRWEKGWSENLEAFRKSGDPADLRPKYIRDKLPLRHHGRFVEAEDPDAEMKWYEDFRAEHITPWLSKLSIVYEFGCGSGHNLAFLQERFPGKEIVGLDWSWASVEIAERLGVFGRRFDFFNPTVPNFPVKAGVLTVGAMEQTGPRRWLPFMEELLLAKPSVVVNVEPQMEWYDASNPVDATAIAVHEAKGFWTGFWDWLRAKRREKQVEILQAKRTGFGSLMIEGYNLIVWRPT